MVNLCVSREEMVRLLGIIEKNATGGNDDDFNYTVLSRIEYLVNYNTTLRDIVITMSNELLKYKDLEIEILKDNEGK